MTTEEVRAGAGWLALREPADAAARSAELAAEVAAVLRPGPVTVHDLGCGTGSMARWLAPRLPGAQHWVLHDRDEDLLPLAAEHPPAGSSDGALVDTVTRRGDVTLLAPDELADADLVTGSAPLDMMSAQEVGRLVSLCAAPGCPVLITLSVTGHVELLPSDPLDPLFESAFNDHQRRVHAGRPLLGPDAGDAAAEAFVRLGREVVVRPSPWRLGPGQRELTRQWLEGWLSAACEQRPELAPEAAPYARRRLAENEAGLLSVSVHHSDLLVRPRPPDVVRR